MPAMRDDIALQLDGDVPGIPGAVVREVDSLPAHLEGGSKIGPCTEAMPGSLLFEVPGIARYLVRDGKTIDVCVRAGADRTAAALFAQTSARATLIHQRGELPLLAATVVSPGGRRIALAGPSSHGKSFLAAELCRRGWQLLADDITRITCTGSVAVAWPAGSKLKLWRDACETLGIEVSGLVPVRRDIGKYFYPVQASTAPSALAAIVRLRVSASQGITPFEPGLARFVVSDSAARYNQIDPLGVRAEHDGIVARVCDATKVVALEGARAVGIREMAEFVMALFP